MEKEKPYMVNERFPKLLGLLFFLGLITCIALFTMHWPLMHDTPLMQYITAAILEGQVPYKDIFDFNFPGSYLVHGIELLLLGRSDISWRIFDLLFILAGIGLFIKWSRIPWIGMVCGTLYGFYHISWGMPSVGQRDFFMAFFLLSGTYYWIKGTENFRWLPIFAGSVLLGLATWMKPTGILWITGNITIISIVLLRTKAYRNIFRFLGIAVGGLLLVSLPFVLYLWRTESLPYFLEIFTEYVIPIHSKDDAKPWTESLIFIFKTFGFAMGLGLIGAIFYKKPFSLSFLLLGWGILVGIFHFVYQQKLWDYHLYPLAIFLFCFLGYIYDFSWKNWKKKAYIFLVFALSATWIIRFYHTVQQEKTSHEYNDFMIVKNLESSLKKEIQEGTEIQVFDSVGGGLNLLYRLKAKLPTRFYFDFVFLHQDNAYVESLKKEFVDGLKNKRPPFIICWNNGWLGPSSLEERMDYVPGFRAFTHENYEISPLSNERVTVFSLKK